MKTQHFRLTTRNLELETLNSKLEMLNFYVFISLRPEILTK